MQPNVLFDGLVETGEELLGIQIYNDDDYTYAYVSGNLADHVDSAEEFVRAYGSRLYDNLDHFKIGKSYDISEFWKDY